MAALTDWVRYDVSEMEMSAARERNQQWDDDSRKRSGEPLFHSEHRLVGQLGEFTFSKFLDAHGLDYDIDTYQGYEERFEYHPDFMVNGKGIDVKTGYCKGRMDRLPETYKFLIANQQMAHPVDYFVHMQAAPCYEYLVIIGYIPRSLAMKYPVFSGGNLVNPCHTIPFADLLPIKNLLEELK